MSPEEEHLTLCATVTTRLTADSIRAMSQDQLRDMESSLVRPFAKSFLFLVSRLTSPVSQGVGDSRPQFESMARTFVQQVVHKYLYSDTIVKIIGNGCVVTDSPAERKDSNQRLVQTLVTLTDSMASVFQTRIPDSFTPEKYFPRLTQVLLLVLKQVADRMHAEEDSDLSLVSDIVSRMCVRGCSDWLHTGLIKPLVDLMDEDSVYTRIGYHVLVHKQPDRSLESILSLILRRSESRASVRLLLQDCVTRRPKAKYLLTEKFVQVTCFPERVFPHNLMHYLSSTDVSAYLAAVCNGIDCWSSPSSLKFRSPTHNLFISSLLVSAAKFLMRLTSEDRLMLHKKLMSGMETQINSTQSELRTSGLFVGQLLMNQLNTGIPVLDLELEKDDNTRFLKRFMSDDTSDEHYDQIPEPAVEQDKKLIQVLGEEERDEKQNEANQEDDPLTPMKKPVYLLDCLQGLQESEDEEWKSVCLSVAEDLIRMNRTTTIDLSEDLTRTLLHMQSDSSDRISALVGVTTTSPRLVSRILIEEFYSKNIALCVRLDVLAVLSKAAVELSSGLVATRDPDLLPKVVPPEASLIEREWQEKIQTKMTGKSRRLTSATKVIEGKANTFAALAPDFFFPLIHGFDGKDVVFALRDMDCFLVSRLLFTLSVILRSASHQLVSRRMASALISFAHEFRSHSDPLVRRAVAFSFATIITSVPASVVLDDLRLELVKIRDWLLVQKEDTDQELKNTAMTALFVMRELIDQNSDLALT